MPGVSTWQPLLRQSIRAQNGTEEEWRRPLPFSPSFSLPSFFLANLSFAWEHAVLSGCQNSMRRSRDLSWGGMNSSPACFNHSCLGKASNCLLREGCLHTRREINESWRVNRIAFREQFSPSLWAAKLGSSPLAGLGLSALVQHKPAPHANHGQDARPQRFTLPGQPALRLWVARYQPPKAVFLLLLYMGRQLR